MSAHLDQLRLYVCGRRDTRIVVSSGMSFWPMTILAFALLAVFAARVDAKISSGLTKKTLNNGISVILVERHQQPIISYRLVVEAGSCYDPPGQSGMAALTSKMIFEGCDGMSGAEFQRWLDSVGAETNITVTRDAAFFDATFTTAEFLSSLKMWGGVLTHPSLGEEEFGNLRRRQITAVLQREDVPIASVLDHAAAELFDGNYATPTGGVAEELETISLADVKNFHARMYRPDRMTLVVSGDFDSRRMLTELQSALNNFVRQLSDTAKISFTLPQAIDSPRIIILDHPHAPSATIVVATAGPSATDSSFVGALTLTHMLGSFPELALLGRLLVEEKGLVATMSAECAMSAGPSIAHIDMSCDNTAVFDVVKHTLDILGSARDSRLSIRDIDDAKRHFEGRYKIAFDTPQNVVKLFGEAAAANGSFLYYRDLLARMSDLSQADIQGTAQVMYAPGGLVIVIWGDAAFFADNLKSLGVVTIIPFGAKAEKTQ